MSSNFVLFIFLCLGCACTVQVCGPGAWLDPAPFLKKKSIFLFHDLLFFLKIKFRQWLFGNFSMVLLNKINISDRVPF